MILSPFLVSLPGMSEPQCYAISVLICMIANFGIEADSCGSQLAMESTTASVGQIVQAQEPRAPS
jgi:hypothetical protein